MGEGGGGGGCSIWDLGSFAEVYLGWREDSIARAMSWVKDGEERTDGRNLACCMVVGGG
jgi:hypothetical protein